MRFMIQSNHKCFYDGLDTKEKGGGEQRDSSLWLKSTMTVFSWKTNKGVATDSLKHEAWFKIRHKSKTTGPAT